MKYFKIKLLGIGAILILFTTSCSKSQNPDMSSNVPNVTVNINISNINTQPYTPLTTIGGVVYVTGGYRGILLYRLNATTILAFDRTCTYDITNTNAYVFAENNGTATCLDCGSDYSMASGKENTGPTTIGLKEYTTSFNPTTSALTVTN